MDCREYQCVESQFGKLISIWNRSAECDVLWLCTCKRQNQMWNSWPHKNYSIHHQNCDLVLDLRINIPNSYIRFLFLETLSLYSISPKSLPLLAFFKWFVVRKIFSFSSLSLSLRCQFRPTFCKCFSIWGCTIKCYKC